jgi:hypothetical protein
MVLPGGHNSKRRIEWIQLGVCFCFQQLNMKVTCPQFSIERTLQRADAHFSSFGEMVKTVDCPESDGDLSQETAVYESVYRDEEEEGDESRPATDDAPPERATGKKPNVAGKKPKVASDHEEDIVPEPEPEPDEEEVQGQTWDP